MIIKHRVIVQTPHFLRKPKIEEFKGFWNSEEEVRQILAKYRPKAMILRLERIYPDHQVLIESNRS